MEAEEVGARWEGGVRRPKPLPLVSMCPQRHMADCGVATLAMFLDVTYEDALLALGGEIPNVIRRGVWFPELQRAAARLGVTTKFKRRPDLELDEGILNIKHRDGSQHVVVLREGVLFDTDLTVWRIDDYCAAKRATTGALMIREDDE